MDKFKNKYLLWFIVFLNSAVFIGCSTPTRKLELQIIVMDKLGTSNTDKYPTEFQELCGTIENICGNKDEINVAFTPIKVIREDLNLKFSLDYLSNTVGDTSKIRKISKALKYFFEDSVINQILLMEPSLDFNCDTFLNRLKVQDNYFIYSSNENLERSGKTIYHSSKELQNAISQYICNNDLDSKIVIIYEPRWTSSVIEIIDKKVKKKNEAAPDITTIPNSCEGKLYLLNEIATQYGLYPAANNNRVSFLKILSTDASILVDDKIYTDKSELVNLFHKNREAGYTLKSNETKLDSDCKIKSIVFISKK